MRIITGTARGKRLAAAPGLHTRPTSDRVKEAIFNIIQFDIEGRRVLDLFCGSGQMALEAVSRGAAGAVLVDNDRGARQAAEKNISACGFDRLCRVSGADSLAFLARQEQGSFGLIFLDPPYDGPLLNSALQDICRFDILAQGGIIVCETRRKNTLDPLPEPYEVLKEYLYGNVKVITVQKHVPSMNG